MGAVNLRPLLPTHTRTRRRGRCLVEEPGVGAQEGLAGGDAEGPEANAALGRALGHRDPVHLGQGRRPAWVCGQGHRGLRQRSGGSGRRVEGWDKDMEVKARTSHIETGGTGGASSPRSSRWPRPGAARGWRGPRCRTRPLGQGGHPGPGGTAPPGGTRPPPERPGETSTWERQQGRPIRI